MGESQVSLLPTEVELAIEVMPCQAERRVYEPAESPHPCTYFAEWGVYHSYSYAASGPPPRPGISQPAVYRGKTSLVPEILSGCRKAPIMAVGINPNLPGWWPATHNALNPVFDDLLQYAHYFRYRAVQKLAIPETQYKKLLGKRADSPEVKTSLTKVGSPIPTQPVAMSMYQAYQGLLDGLAARQGWAAHKLTVGEDLSYGNMVACPSAKWLTEVDPADQGMPVMSGPVVEGIVHECFQQRRYFLRQLFQSLPAVLLVFSGTTRDAFIRAMEHSFIEGDPKVGEAIPDLLARKIVVRYGKTSDGRELTARVIFTPHATGDPQAFAAQRQKVIDILAEEASAGRITLNPNTGHLGRPPGGCVFCKNALYQIGPCEYEQELVPLAPGTVVPPPASTAQAASAQEAILSERAEQARLLERFVAAGSKKSRSKGKAKTGSTTSDMSPFRILSS
jgi:hypothetical protein